MAPRDGLSKHASIDSTRKRFRTADGIPDTNKDTDLHCDDVANGHYTNVTLVKNSKLFTPSSLPK